MFCHEWLGRGWPLVYAPEAVVDHFHDQSLSGFLSMHYRYGRGARMFHLLNAVPARDLSHAAGLRFYAAASVALLARADDAGRAHARPDAPRPNHGGSGLHARSHAPGVVRGDGYGVTEVAQGFSPACGRSGGLSGQPWVLVAAGRAKNLPGGRLQQTWVVALSHFAAHCPIGGAVQFLRCQKAAIPPPSGLFEVSDVKSP